MKIETRIEGTEIEPTKIESLSAIVAMNATAQAAKAEDISGKISIRSRLKDGLLRIRIDPVFDWGVSLMDFRAADIIDDEITRRLIDAGFDQNQIDKIASVLEQESLAIESSEFVLEDSDGLMDVGIKATGIDASGISLPSVDLNLDPIVDVQEVNIGNVNVSAKSSLLIRNIENIRSPVPEFLCVTEGKGDPKFSRAEINDLVVDPLLIPEISVPNVKAGVELAEVNVSSIPVSFLARNAESRFTLPVLDKKLRWKNEICIKVFRWKKCAWIKYGIDIKIDIDYTWAVSLLNVAVNIKAICVKGLAASVEATGISVKNIAMGGVRSKNIAMQVK
jgi:hypothetical protein